MLGQDFLTDFSLPLLISKLGLMMHDDKDIAEYLPVLRTESRAFQTLINKEIANIIYILR